MRAARGHSHACFRRCSLGTPLRAGPHGRLLSQDAAPGAARLGLPGGGLARASLLRGVCPLHAGLHAEGR